MNGVNLADILFSLLCVLCECHSVHTSFFLGGGGEYLGNSRGKRLGCNEAPIGNGIILWQINWSHDFERSST